MKGWKTKQGDTFFLRGSCGFWSHPPLGRRQSKRNLPDNTNLHESLISKGKKDLLISVRRFFGIVFLRILALIVATERSVFCIEVFH